MGRNNLATVGERQTTVLHQSLEHTCNVRRRLVGLIYHSYATIKGCTHERRIVIDEVARAYRSLLD